MEYTVGTILLMILITIVIGYYINATISIHKYKTNNLTKYYMAVFLGLQMGILELIFMYRYEKNLGEQYVLLFIFLVIATIYIGHKLYTFDYMNDRQFMLAMIESNSLALTMANKTDAQDERVKKLVNKIKTETQSEIDEMQYILKTL